jgi:hypothetical protein
MRLTLRLAIFDLENLFKRPAIMNRPAGIRDMGSLPEWKNGKAVLQDSAELTQLIQKDRYSQKDKEKMLEIMNKLSECCIYK